ncbi:MAG: hypothetical protein KF773_19330 [Deltaproteobacteria bacterium]|nr:hypothetical protein [Deltaproteobacteria bacterium]
MTFPFRFYGHMPADWHEGGDLGHVFEVAFASEPTAEQKARIAATAVAAFAAGEPRAWLWSRHVASFAVGEREPGTARAVFAEVTRFLEAVHAIAPLRQAIFCGARTAGDSAWDAWTRATQPVPDAGPVYDPPRAAPFGRPDDPELPVAAADPELDRARGEASAGAPVAAIETGRGLTLERVDDPAFAYRAWMYLRDDPRFGPPPDDNCHWENTPGAAHSWLRGPHGDVRGFALVADDGRGQLVPGISSGRASGESIGEAGALVAWNADPDDRRGPHRLYRVSVAAEPVPVWTAEAEIKALARVADGWLVATANQLVVLRDEAPRLAIASERRSRATAWLAAVHGGTCVLVGRDNDTEVWGYHDGALAQLDALDHAFSAPRVIAGRIIFWSGQDTYELCGLDALLASWQAKRKPARKQAKARASAVSLERSDGALVPALQLRPMSELSDDLVAPYAATARKRVFQSPASGRTVAVDDAIQGAVMWLDASGALVRHPASWGNGNVRFSPDGHEAIVFQPGFANLVHVDLAASVATAHQLTVDRKEVRDAAALGGGRFLALLAKTLELRSAAGAVLAELALAKCTRLHAVRGDLAILACDATGKKTRVVAITADRLLELAAFPDRLDGAGLIGGDVAIRTIDGDRMILRGLDEALAAAIAKVTPAEEKDEPTS